MILSILVVGWLVFLVLSFTVPRPAKWKMIQLLVAMTLFLVAYYHYVRMSA